MYGTKKNSLNLKRSENLYLLPSFNIKLKKNLSQNTFSNSFHTWSICFTK